MKGPPKVSEATVKGSPYVRQEAYRVERFSKGRWRSWYEMGGTDLDRQYAERYYREYCGPGHRLVHIQWGPYAKAVLAEK